VIVGRAPTPAVQRLADDYGITVTGRVDDVRPYMSKAAAYVVPLRIGGGTRLKIFEAMAMGKAVVSIGAARSNRPPGLWSSNATTGPPSRESWNKRWFDSPGRTPKVPQ
jgi:glycosyltransferase involved in cell wall biosynthesis